MAAPKKKFYIVWNGSRPGVYSTWSECEGVTKGVKGAKFKSFPTRVAAERAFRDGATAHWGKGKTKTKKSTVRKASVGEPIPGSLCVDAAWNSVTKVMEYRGVWLDDGSVVFAEGPFEAATNNIGEFLAVVQALEYLSDRDSEAAVYTDSKTAMSWVRKRLVRSESIQLGKTSKEIEHMVEAALKWMKGNPQRSRVLKWETQVWGDVPADYGRK
jgi:ribonuclease HI